ncbi:MAG: BON domain-containing protein [Pyrinomonadaceae bacterium]|nr:BON domain-containing protein [Pyrinomonadaceae bacterium]
MSNGSSQSGRTGENRQGNGSERDARWGNGGAYGNLESYEEERERRNESWSPSQSASGAEDDDPYTANRTDRDRYEQPGGGRRASDHRLDDYGYNRDQEYSRYSSGTDDRDDRGWRPTDRQRDYEGRDQDRRMQQRGDYGNELMEDRQWGAFGSRGSYEHYEGHGSPSSYSPQGGYGNRQEYRGSNRGEGGGRYGDPYAEPGGYSELSGGRGGYGTQSGYQQGREYGPGGSQGESSGREHYARQAFDRGTEFRFNDQPQSGLHRGKGPRGYSRSDERIREDVNERLWDDSHLDASDIEVEVKSGEVTLRGEVDDRNAKRRAEDLAESCSGVKNVQNSLRIKSRNSEKSGYAASYQNTQSDQGKSAESRSNKRSSGGQ